MKSRSIIFRQDYLPLVRDGRKTQMRVRLRGKALSLAMEGGSDERLVQALTAHRCPLGDPGDELWVREKWAFLGTDMMRHGRTHSVQDAVIRYGDGEQRTITSDWRNVEPLMAGDDRYRSMFYMPKWASRLTLVVKAVSVERLSDITDEDATEEGFIPDQGVCVEDGWRRRIAFLSSFLRPYEIANDANPWVFAVKFAVASR